MDFEIIDHARERMLERGATEDEIGVVLAEGQAMPAPRGRLIKEKVFTFGRLWKGRAYPQKKIRLVFVEESNKLVVITVYVYYGSWGEQA